MKKEEPASELKTPGFTPFMYISDQPLFHVCRDVPIVDALSEASNLLFLAKAFAMDAAYAKGCDRHAWAAHYLAAMGKAVVDDVVKVLERRPLQAAKKTEV